MITGDKQETAINIAISCKLIRRPDNVLLCNAASSREAARGRLQQLLEAVDKAHSIEFNQDASQVCTCLAVALHNDACQTSQEAISWVLV